MGKKGNNYSKDHHHWINDGLDLDRAKDKTKRRRRGRTGGGDLFEGSLKGITEEL